MASPRLEPSIIALFTPRTRKLYELQLPSTIDTTVQAVMLRCHNFLPASMIFQNSFTKMAMQTRSLSGMIPRFERRIVRKAAPFIGYNAGSIEHTLLFPGGTLAG